jgi:hypothetical protein
MEQRLTDIETREADRLRLLDAVYEMTEGNTHAYVSMVDAYTRAGIDYARGTAAYQYLSHERLLLGRASHNLSITHEGVKEREAAISGQGQRRTPHFSQPAVQHVVQTFNAPVYGSVQVGGERNIANVTNTSGVPTHDLSTLIAAIGGLRTHAQALSDAERFVALESISKAEETAAAERPDLLRLKILLKGLEVFVPLAPYIPHVMQVLAQAVGGA